MRWKRLFFIYFLTAILIFIYNFIVIGLAQVIPHNVPGYFSYDSGFLFNVYSSLIVSIFYLPIILSVMFTLKNYNQMKKRGVFGKSLIVLGAFVIIGAIISIFSIIGDFSEPWGQSVCPALVDTTPCSLSVIPSYFIQYMYLFYGIFILGAYLVSLLVFWILKVFKGN